MLDEEVTNAIEKMMPNPIKENCIDFASIQDNLPELPPILIHDVLRYGDKMCFAAPSKAGKTFCMIQLAIAMATGTKWLNRFQCEKTPILFCNLELKNEAMSNRIEEVRKRLFVSIESGMLHFVTFRGLEKTFNTQHNEITSLVKSIHAGAVFVDPVYKSGLTNENDAEKVSNFCRELDVICKETNAALIYTHHFSKGYQFEKSAIDRASGSGVFARDADAIVTLSALDEPDGYLAEFTLRGFRTPEPFAVRFDYPLHTPAPEWDSAPLRGERRRGRPPTMQAGKEAVDEASKKVIVDLAAKNPSCPKTMFLEKVYNNVSGGKARARALVDELLNEGCLVETRDKGHFNKKTISLPDMETE